MTTYNPNPLKVLVKNFLIGNQLDPKKGSFFLAPMGQAHILGFSGMGDLSKEKVWAIMEMSKLIRPDCM